MSIVSQTAVSEPVALVLPALMSAPFRTKGPMPKRWTREEYYRLAEQGWFQNQRVELIDGELYLLSPQSPQHVSCIERIRRMLEKAFGESYWVRVQSPLVHGAYSEPEPDLAIVRASLDDHDTAHPTTSALIVEVSKSSLKHDQQVKQHLYAGMGVADYWILDIENRQLIVFRDPKQVADAPLGFEYSSRHVLSDTETISPLERPMEKLAVSGMLPSAK